jgi:hypothetical protein
MHVTQSIWEFKPGKLTNALQGRCCSRVLERWRQLPSFTQLAILPSCKHACCCSIDEQTIRCINLTIYTMGAEPAAAAKCKVVIRGGPDGSVASASVGCVAAKDVPLVAGPLFVRFAHTFTGRTVR